MLVLTVLLSGLIQNPVPAAPAAPRFEGDIAKFEEQDKKSPVKPGGVVFVGSSMIRLWKLSDSFPGLPAVNRGFGGSQMADAARYADRIVVPYKPRIVVLYSGDNDLNAGVKPEAVRDEYVKFAAAVHRGLPDAKLIWLPIKPSPSRAKLIDAQRRTNALILEEVKGDPKAATIDVWQRQVDASGKPRPELFAKDMLHFNEAGYALWAERLKPLLKE